MKQKKKSKVFKYAKMLYFAFGTVAVLNAAMKEIKANQEKKNKE